MRAYDLSRKINDFYYSQTEENNLYDSIIISKNCFKREIRILHYRIERKWVSFYDVTHRTEHNQTLHAAC